ncbi:MULTISPECIES: extracellular solute-binding protein [unclassified Streptomyces]|uniref:ABC transporter substrate-binding protein n=1 Tax=unclassified Streptomyces TaxID=2593676 RepID=UPI002E80E67E|nr:extracellular solute-binding protein [Streptomyces sp. NBC_00589]WTI34178.1 extracellular solute-binding protein [Streptomyces sp. NBC_00775]WUB32150.1 extracellular solute-binding protein [Streptomyces sp. NBC_00589]
MKLTSRTSRSALAAVTVSLSLAMFATACGGDDGSDKAGTAAKPVTLTYWGWSLGAQQVADEFNKTHKDIKVKFSAITGGPDGYAKITNAIKAGNAPDVVGIEYPQLPEFASQGMLEDISGEVGDTVKAKFSQSIQDRVTLGGKTWAVPYDATPNLLYYRKDIFKKAGVAVPTTWDEYKAAAKKIKKADKNVRIGDWANDDPALLPALAWQAGAKWYGTEGDAWKVGINDAASKKVADYWQGLVDDDLVATAGFTSPEFTKARNDGTVASYIGASWSAGGQMTAFPKQSGKWGIAPLPNWGTAASGMYGGTSYAVPKGTKHVEAAAEFAAWAATTPAAVKARLSKLETPSSALPANAELRDVAAGVFDDQGYFGGDDVYKIAGAAADTIVPDWTWGPVQTATNTAITDASSKGTVADGLKAGQSAAEKAIKDRGLNLAQ